MNRVLWPLIGFFALVVLLAAGLRHDPRDIGSPLVGKPAAAFSLPRLDAPDRTFSPEAMRGRVWLLNVWATWCASCREEHATLVEIAAAGKVPIVGLNYKDVRGDARIEAEKLSTDVEKALALERARRWLAAYGNPYAAAVLDLDGRTGIDYGVYGVPETFLIDRAGVIRFRLAGPLTPEAFQGKILPLVTELEK